MNILKTKEILIEAVRFSDEKIFVKMNDGQEYAGNIRDYPNLSKGSPSQLEKYAIEGNGRWIHWEELDEDLSAEGFIQ